MKSRILSNTIKSIGKCFLIGAMRLSATGCIENLLNTEPYDQIASTNMWTSDYLTDLGMAGVYNVLRDGYSTGGSSGRQLYALDRFGMSTQQDASNAPAYLNGTINSADGLFKDIWKAQYTGIVRANDAIHNIPEISPSSAEKKHVM
ncbi:MAG: hypothetical protein LIP01_03090 [Tannerellaceae bacterium]|nr:hypothetical protein [Tannerellaceae bacterium]